MADLDKVTVFKRYASGASLLPATVATARYVVATIFVAACLFPFYIMLTTALKRDSDIFAWPPVWRFHPSLQNFYDALFVFGGQGVLTFAVNSLIVTLASTLLSVGLGSMAAYGLARFSFLGRKQLSFWICRHGSRLRLHSWCRCT